ncbi:hypothetical protein V490_00658 [Pseudogymnoascus sp. VKM F-3557]|nr:hypothetical protein V490_00658 [Pseudogymnoascus sp. VKM F-3557]
MRPLDGKTATPTATRAATVAATLAVTLAVIWAFILGATLIVIFSTVTLADTPVILKATVTPLVNNMRPRTDLQC